MGKDLSGSFEEFLDYETEVFDKIEEDYSEEIREEAEKRYKNQIPRGPLDQQARWLESKFYNFLPELDTSKYDNDALNQIHSSLKPLDGEGLDCIHGTLEGPDRLDYDAIVLDHCVIFEVLQKSSRQYYSNGRKQVNWEDTLEFIDKAAENSDIYVPSDIVAKSDRYDYMGSQEAAKIFQSEFEDLDIDRKVEVPDGHERMEEDLRIGSAAEELGDDVLIASYDSDFKSAVPNHYDIRSNAPLLP